MVEYADEQAKPLWSAAIWNAPAAVDVTEQPASGVPQPVGEMLLVASASAARAR